MQLHCLVLLRCAQSFSLCNSSPDTHFDKLLCFRHIHVLPDHASAIATRAIWLFGYCSTRQRSKYLDERRSCQFFGCNAQHALWVCFLHRVHRAVPFWHSPARVDHKRGSQEQVLAMLLHLRRHRVSSDGTWRNCCHSESLLVGCIDGHGCCDISILVQQGPSDTATIGRLPDMGARGREACTEHRREISLKRRHSVDV